MTWRRKIQQASFKGVPFHYSEVGIDSGRRAVGFEYPERELPFTEDLGRKQRKYQISGYILQDHATGEYYAARDALIRVLEEPGPGNLVHRFIR